MYSGSVYNDKSGMQYNFEPVNLENPVQGIKVTPTFNEKTEAKFNTRKVVNVFANRELGSQKIAIDKPARVIDNCFVAVGEYYKDLQARDVAPKEIPFNGNGLFSSYIKDEGKFIYTEIFEKRYLVELESSPNFHAGKLPNGEVVAYYGDKKAYYDVIGLSSAA